MRRLALAAALLGVAACADRGSSSSAPAAAKVTPTPVTGPRVVMPSGAVISAPFARNGASNCNAGTMFAASSRTGMMMEIRAAGSVCSLPP